MEWATLPLKKYAQMSGRARRKEFWSFWLLTIAAYIVAAILDGILGMSTMIGGVYGPIVLLVVLALLTPSFCVAIRRLHDTGRSGWWLLIGFIPIIGALVLIYFYVIDGVRGPNEYGPDPKEGEHSTPQAV